jgi:hypothetical protein
VVRALPGLESCIAFPESAVLPAAAIAALSLLGPDPAPLVRDLAHDEFRQRTRAGEMLLALGARSIPALNDAIEHGADAERRRRATELLRRIERQIQSEHASQPTLVQLHFKDVPLTVVLAELEKQTGCLFWARNDEPGLGERIVSCSTNGPEAFFEVLYRLTEPTSLDFSTARPIVPQTNSPSPNPLQLPYYRITPATEQELASLLQKHKLDKFADEKRAAAIKNLEAFEQFKKAIEAQAQKAVPVPQPAVPLPLVPMPVVPRGVFPQPPVAVLAKPTLSTVQPDQRAIFITRREGSRPAVSLHGAVRVDLSTMTTDGTNLTAGFRIVAEPKLKLERLGQARIEQALATDGRLLVPNLIQAPLSPRDPSNRQAIARVQIIQLNNATISQPGLTLGAQRFTVPFQNLDGFEGIRELNGTISAAVPAPVTELLRIESLVVGKSFNAFGPNQIEFSVKVDDLELGEEYPASIVLGYFYTSGLTFPLSGDLAAFTKAGKYRSVTVPDGTTGFAYNGVYFTDANDQPYIVRASRIRSTTIIRNGQIYGVRTIGLTLRPTVIGQGPPVRVGYYASPSQYVDLPFQIRTKP